jgi:hypothetical protein
MKKLLKKVGDKKVKESTIEEDVQEYNLLRTKVKTIKNRMDELATKIKEFSIKNGTKDDKGNCYSTNDTFIYGAKAVKKIKWNTEKAEEYFRGKKLWDKVIDIRESINDDKVEQLITNNELTEDELEDLVDMTVNYSVDVHLKENEEKIQENIAKHSPVTTKRTGQTQRKVQALRHR